MQNLAIIIFGFLLLVLQTTLAALIPLYSFTPNLILLITIYLGVSHEIHIVRGAVIAFILGYLLDSFCGNPMGLQTFVIVAAFMVARGAGLRLFLRGPAFQVLLAFAMCLVAGGTSLALPAIFEGLTSVGDHRETALMLLNSALVTALFAPLIFAAMRKIGGWLGQRGEEGSAAL